MRGEDRAFCEFNEFEFGNTPACAGKTLSITVSGQ